MTGYCSRLPAETCSNLLNRRVQHARSIPCRAGKSLRWFLVHVPDLHRRRPPYIRHVACVARAARGPCRRLCGHMHASPWHACKGEARARGRAGLGVVAALRGGGRVRVRGLQQQRFEEARLRAQHLAHALRDGAAPRSLPLRARRAQWNNQNVVCKKPFMRLAWKHPAATMVQWVLSDCYLSKGYTASYAQQRAWWTMHAAGSPQQAASTAAVCKAEAAQGAQGTGRGGAKTPAAAPPARAGAAWRWRPVCAGTAAAPAAGPGSGA